MVGWNDFRPPYLGWRGEEIVRARPYLPPLILSGSNNQGVGQLQTRVTMGVVVPSLRVPTLVPGSPNTRPLSPTHPVTCPPTTTTTTTTITTTTTTLPHSGTTHAQTEPSDRSPCGQSPQLRQSCCYDATNQQMSWAWASEHGRFPCESAQEMRWRRRFSLRQGRIHCLNATG